MCLSDCLFRWPLDKERYATIKVENWLEEVKLHVKVKEGIPKYLEAISRKLFTKNHLTSDDFHEFTSYWECCPNPRVCAITEMTLKQFIPSKYDS